MEYEGGESETMIEFSLRGVAVSDAEKLLKDHRGAVKATVELR